MTFYIERKKLITNIIIKGVFLNNDPKREEITDFSTLQINLFPSGLIKLRRWKSLLKLRLDFIFTEIFLFFFQEAQNPPLQNQGRQLGKDDGRGRNFMQHWLNRCTIL